MKADKMSMASSLEIRAPFLDKDLIEYFFNISREYKINKSIFKKTIGPHIPKVILDRKKQGFSLPISTWFNNKDFLNRVVPQIEDLSKRNIFKQILVELISKKVIYLGVKDYIFKQTLVRHILKKETPLQEKVYP